MTQSLNDLVIDQNLSFTPNLRIPRTITQSLSHSILHLQPLEDVTEAPLRLGKEILR